MSGRGRTLTLRAWLILAVVAVVVATVVAEIALSQGMGTWQRTADQNRLATVRHLIGSDAAQWRNAAWQQRTSAALASLGVEAQVIELFPGSAGRLVYATAGARAFLDTGAAGTAGPQAGAATSGETQAPAFQKIVIPGGPGSPGGIVFLWFTQPSPGSPSPWLWALAALVAILVVLAVVVWLLGRYVLRPLAAMSRAAEGIAGGDLDVYLPSSPAREVAEVAAALEGMSAALRKSLQRQATLEEERKLFVGAIAHDLRTPLFMLRGYLQGLESGVAATPEKVAHYVAASRAKADALERLIADLFAYTRLEYLEQEPAREPLDLGDLLRQAVEGAQLAATTKGIVLTLVGPAESGALVGDRHLLARAVDNLLDNALRYAPQGGHIQVCWSQDEQALRFTVADSGPGIAAGDLPHVFTPLYRAETSRNRQTGGAGLGLTIARRILRAHGGDLVAANAAEGGAVFTATLPAAQRVLLPAEPLAVSGP